MPRKKSTEKKAPETKKVEMPLWFEERQKIAPDVWKALELRAKELERKKETLTETERTNSFLGFTWGATRCALAVEEIEEIKEFEYIEPVPNTPEIVLGILNLRGEIVPVFDIRRLWNMAREEITGEAKILIMDKDSMKFGFLVDSVLSTIQLLPEQILPANRYSGELNNPYTLGVYTSGGELWMIINAKAVKKADELIISD